MTYFFFSLDFTELYFFFFFYKISLTLAKL